MPKLSKPFAKIVSVTPNILDVIEDSARLCYLSEPKHPLPENALPSEEKARLFEQATFLLSKIRLGHHSILEHGNITVDFGFDRGVSHELVRHRLQAISQSSTRYCNFSQEKYDSQISVIEPFFFDKDEIRQVAQRGKLSLTKWDVWMAAMENAEYAYMKLIKLGATPSEARSVLPNSLETFMRSTMNVREWRHVLKIRTEAGVHQQMAEVMVPLLWEFRKQWPILFGDIEPADKWLSLWPDPYQGV